MNISLTKQELVMLLRLANIGDWVMFSDLEEEEAFENINRVERGGKLQQLAFTYEQEFEQHGLSRLHLLNVSKHNQGDIG